MIEKIKLFCLPFAGGSANVYKVWKQYIDKRIELCPVELPGRGSRFNEPLLDSIDSQVEDIYRKIYSYLNKGPYSIFGYSMGSILTFELIKKIEDERKNLPIHAFFGAKAPLQIPRSKRMTYLLEEKEFIADIMELGGTPEEIFKNEELKEIYIRILRSDYKAVETYNYKESIINCNITALYGKHDGDIPEKINRWGELTSCRCSYNSFDGGHFFIHDNTEKIVQIINTEILDMI